MKTSLPRILAAALLIALVMGTSVPPAWWVSGSGTTGHSLYLPLAMKDYLPTIIPDTTKILGDVSSQDLSSVSADGTVYYFSGTTPELENLQVGDIMIGGVSIAAPYGFLRQVTAISSGSGGLNSPSSGELTVTTTDATIEQAIQQVRLEVDHTITPEEIQNASSLNGLHSMTEYGPQGLSFEILIDNVVLYDDDGDLNTTNDQVVANGGITLSPTIHLSLSIKDFHIQNLTFFVSSVETASLTISSAAELSAKKQYNFPPIILGAIPTPIGPILPELTFYVGVNGSLHVGVSTGISDTTSWTAGVKYSQGQWENLNSWGNNFTYTPPVFSIEMDAKGYLGAQFSLMVDGVAGPHADVEAYLRLHVDPLATSAWTLYGGLSGKAGVEIKIFSFLIASYDADLFDIQTIIAPPPTVDVKGNGSKGPVNLTDQDTYTISWTSTNANACTGSDALAGHSGTSGNYPDGPKTAGNYTYTMTCNNVSGGASDSVQVNIASSEGAAFISAGGYHTCALIQAGGVKCWGYNYYGQLGDGTTTERHTLVDVMGLTSGVSAIYAGFYHTCAMTQTDGVKCWGDNSSGELGDGSINGRYTPVDVTGLASGVIAISAGNSHTCALTQAGVVKCWGHNAAGELGDGTTTERYTPVDVTGLASGVIAISAGNSHTCALTQAGGVKCWGYNYYGQLGDGTGTTRLTPVDVVGLNSGVIAISAGGNHTCALTQTGGVKCWGYNFFGQLGDGTTTKRNTPADVTGLTSGVIAISAGYEHTCALTQAGGVKCWGDNGQGRLGDGTTTERHTPVNVAGLISGVSTISAGFGHTCAVTQTGKAKCWGYNPDGELGDGTTTDRHTPVDVVGFP